MSRSLADSEALAQVLAALNDALAAQAADETTLRGRPLALETAFAQMRFADWSYLRLESERSRGETAVRLWDTATGSFDAAKFVAGVAWRSCAKPAPSALMAPMSSYIAAKMCALGAPAEVRIQALSTRSDPARARALLDAFADLFAGAKPASVDVRVETGGGAVLARELRP